MLIESLDPIQRFIYNDQVAHFTHETNSKLSATRNKMEKQFEALRNKIAYLKGRQESLKLWNRALAEEVREFRQEQQQDIALSLTHAVARINYTQEQLAQEALARKLREKMWLEMQAQWNLSLQRYYAMIQADQKQNARELLAPTKQELTLVKTNGKLEEQSEKQKAVIRILLNTTQVIENASKTQSSKAYKQSNKESETKLCASYQVCIEVDQEESDKMQQELLRSQQALVKAYANRSAAQKVLKAAQDALNKDLESQAERARQKKLVGQAKKTKRGDCTASSAPKIIYPYAFSLFSGVLGLEPIPLLVFSTNSSKRKSKMFDAS